MKIPLGKLLFLRRSSPGTVWDGRDSAYRWTEEELYTLWVEAEPPADREPRTLTFSENEFTVCAAEKRQTAAYTLPEGISVYGRPEGDVCLQLADGTVLKSVVFREEQTAEDGTIPLLTAVFTGPDGMTGTAGFVRPAEEAKLAHARQGRKPMKLDGAISAYRWVDRELMGEWIDFGMAADPDPVRLIFEKERFAIKTEAGEKSFAYEIPGGTELYGRPSGEIYLKLTDCREFRELIFHEESLNDGGTVPILSATIFEHDGRGEIVIAEFVRTEDLKKLPAGFRSKACTERNDWTSASMVKTVPTE